MSRSAQLILGLALLAPLLATAAPLYIARPIGTLGGASGDVRAINNAGQIVGFALNRRNEPNAYVSTAGSMLNLQPADATASYANGINDQGVVAGMIETGGATRGDLHERRSIQYRRTWSGNNSRAAAINNLGQVAGTSGVNGNAARHALRYTPRGGLHDLGTLGGPDSVASDINRAGSVVGYSDVAGGSF